MLINHIMCCVSHPSPPSPPFAITQKNPSRLLVHHWSGRQATHFSSASPFEHSKVYRRFSPNLITDTQRSGKNTALVSAEQCTMQDRRAHSFLEAFLLGWQRSTRNCLGTPSVTRCHSMAVALEGHHGKLYSSGFKAFPELGTTWLHRTLLQKLP